jgi:hypothetical protein
MHLDRDITRHDCKIADAVTMAVGEMLDEAERRGISIKAISHATSIPVRTLQSYREGTAISLPSFIKIIGMKRFPTDLASMPLEVMGKAVCEADEQDAAPHDFAIACAELLLEHLKAQHPDSPDAERIGHRERPGLKVKTKTVLARASAAI